MNVEQLLQADISVQQALIAAAGLGSMYFFGKKTIGLAKSVAFGSTFAAMLFLTGLGGTGYSLGSLFKDKPATSALPDEQLVELAKIATPENLKTILEYRAQNTPASAPAEERIATKDLEALVAHYVALNEKARQYDPDAPADVGKEEPKSLLSYFNTSKPAAPEPIDGENSVFRLTSEKADTPIVLASIDRDDTMSRPLSWSTLCLGLGLIICGIVKFSSQPG